MTHPLQSAVTRFCLLRAGCADDLVKTPFTKDVAPAFAHRMSAAELNEAYAGARKALLQDGLVALRPKKRQALTLTPAGRIEAAKALALPEWPEDARWRAFVVPRLVVLALGKLDENTLAATANADGLRKEILRVRLGESVKTKTVNDAASLRASAAVGTVQKDIKAIRKALLQRAAEAIAFGSANWPGAPETAPVPVRPPVLATPTPPFVQAAAPDLDEFARVVKEVAKETPTGRIGLDLVFINHVWKHLSRTHPEWRLTLDAFKARLREAALAGRIKLIISNILEDELIEDMLESRIDDGYRRWELVDLAAWRKQPVKL